MTYSSGEKLWWILLILICIGCERDRSPGQDNGQLQQDVETYLEEYSREYQERYRRSAEAEWQANTRIVEGDTATGNEVQRANRAFADFTGSQTHTLTANRYLDQADRLTDLQVRQLRQIIYAAADNPESADSLVTERIRLESELIRTLFGYDFTIDGSSVTPNGIDRILRESSDLSDRRIAWEASKEVGIPLREGLDTVRTLRNRTVDALGFEDYFAYQVFDYGMGREEMLELMEQVNRELRPLYRELHTWVRHELAARYGVEEVPDMIPAHWLPNRWGQNWSGMAEGGSGLDSAVGMHTAEEVVGMAEEFYISLGFSELPEVFWDKSSLYPLPDSVDYKKNNHASAWHIDLERDVRSLMSVEPTEYWYETAHHELGHVYYNLTYSNPQVPLTLRKGANRAFHEAVGSLGGFAAMQQPYLRERGLAGGAEGDSIRVLLNQALNYVVFIPFAAGVMTEFESDLYGANLTPEQFNSRWWELKRQHQGIVPPSERGSRYGDAASKTHIIDDAAQYYDYAISSLILFQLHDHIARTILEEDPRSANYHGSVETGDFLRELMRPGATVDWQTLLEEATGEGLSARAMVEYFQPLTEWLREQNRGREHTL